MARVAELTYVLEPVYWRAAGRARNHSQVVVAGCRRAQSVTRRASGRGQATVREQECARGEARHCASTGDTAGAPQALRHGLASASCRASASSRAVDAIFEGVQESISGAARPRTSGKPT
ncbi:hypothetical protein WOLCODRAFT_148200 [Wolfiporia cocos MD-104 SS10]|uniref:Uncharacterized protein n=1 Tax=Wolfiporia cocos (strain MD-104) TaxID=742152 RepID=A0A2H3IVZ9_WOLCO|nr:hypothetical protein WOLCODRAFT_148200 [Wolfiporia cocos MD-104 SS10]